MYHKKQIDTDLEFNALIKKLIDICEFKKDIDIEKYLKIKNGKEEFIINNKKIIAYIKKNQIKVYLDVNEDKNLKDTIKEELNILFNRKVIIVNTFMDYLIPTGFYYTTKGIATERYIKTKVDGETIEEIKFVLISDKWLFVTANVYSDAQYIYQMEIMAMDPENKKDIKTKVCNKDVLARSQLCISFLSNELNVSTEDGKKQDYSKFFFEFITLNNFKLEKKRTVPTLGWDKYNKDFAPYSKKIHLDYSNDKYNFFKKMVDGFSKSENNNCEEFKKKMIEHAKNKFADFAISCAFASPLLKIVGVRSFLVNLYGPSKFQKSLSTRFGLAAFGNYNELEMSGSDTTNVIKAKIHKLQNFLCYIDEIVQKGKKSYNVINGYDFGNEKDRHRLDKNSEIKEAKTWRTIAICTSETTIQKETDMEGEINRSLCLSVDCRPKSIRNDEKKTHIYAQECYRFINQNFGYLGEEYLNEVIRIKDKLLGFYNKISEELYKTNISGNLTDHISSISIICLGNYLYRTLFYNLDEIQYSINLGKFILNSLEKQEELDPKFKFLNCIYNFFETNRNSFIIRPGNGEKEIRPHAQIYGLCDIENDEIIFIMDPLRDYLIKNNFDWNYKKYLIDEGIIKYTARRIDKMLNKRIIIPYYKQENNSKILDIEKFEERKAIQEEMDVS